jgi:threonyl-tRNA synthetase
MILPVNNQYHLDYATKLYERMFDEDLRVELDAKDEKLGYKIRQSQTQKVPYSIVIGNEEVANNTVTVRAYGSEVQTTYPVETFVSMMKQEIKAKNKL